MYKRAALPLSLYTVVAHDWAQRAPKSPQPVIRCHWQSSSHTWCMEMVCPCEVPGALSSGCRWQRRSEIVARFEPHAANARGVGGPSKACVLPCQGFILSHWQDRAPPLPGGRGGLGAAFWSHTARVRSPPPCRVTSFLPREGLGSLRLPRKASVPRVTVAAS